MGGEETTEFESNNVIASIVTVRQNCTRLPPRQVHMTPQEISERQIERVYALVDDPEHVVFDRVEILDLLKAMYPSEVAEYLLGRAGDP